MAHVHCMLDIQVYKQILKICNTYCFPTATMICTNAAQCYVIRTMSVLVNLKADQISTSTFS